MISKSEDKRKAIQADDIVVRLRKQVARAEVDGVLPSWYFAKVVWEAADEIERLRDEVEHWRRIAETEHAMWANNLDAGDAGEIERLRADVKRWHTIATNLIHGAEQQIDEFREPWDKSTNEAWLGAWHDYHQAVLDEGAKL